MRAIALIMTLSAPGLMAATAPTDPAPFESGTFESTRLGTVHVFGSAPSTQIAIILSGDGG